MTALAMVLATAVVLAALLLHYEVLRRVLALAPRPGLPARVRMVGAMAAVLLSHGGAILLFGIASWAADGRLGGFGGARPPSDLADHLYASAAAYIGGGSADAYPTGALRLLLAVEGLNGFMLIGWSATFTYLLMQRLWLEHPGMKERVRGQAPLQNELLNRPAGADQEATR